MPENQILTPASSPFSAVPDLQLGLTPHHIGCAVTTMETGMATYVETLKLVQRSRAFDVPSQGVSVCFIQLATGFYLELVSPHPGQTKLSNYLRTGFYHLCFLTADLTGARAYLKNRRFTALPAFNSEAFDCAPCQFFLSPELHLVELAEMAPDAFHEFFLRNVVSLEQP